MPVEIRELQITAIVQDTPNQQFLPNPEKIINKEKIIAECVEQVLEILKQKNER